MGVIQKTADYYTFYKFKHSIRIPVSWQTLREELLEKFRVMSFCNIWVTPTYEYRISQ